MNKLRQFTSRLLRGYAVVLRTVGGMAAIVIATMTVAVVGVYPLWFLATRAREAYTTIVSIALLTLLTVMLLKKARRLFEATRNNEFPRGTLVRRARSAAVVGLTLILAYATAVLAARGNYAAAGVAGIALLLTVGLPAGRTTGTNADSS